jgi:hypothetical protein
MVRASLSLTQWIPSLPYTIAAAAEGKVTAPAREILENDPAFCSGYRPGEGCAGPDFSVSGPSQSPWKTLEICASPRLTQGGPCNGCLSPPTGSSAAAPGLLPNPPGRRTPATLLRRCSSRHSVVSVSDGELDSDALVTHAHSVLVGRGRRTLGTLLRR